MRILFTLLIALALLSIGCSQHVEFQYFHQQSAPKLCLARWEEASGNTGYFCVPCDSLKNLKVTELP